MTVLSPSLLGLPLVDRGRETIVPIFLFGPGFVDIARSDRHLKKIGHALIRGQAAVLAPAVDQLIVGSRGILFLQAGAGGQDFDSERLVGLGESNRLDERAQHSPYSLRIVVKIFHLRIKRLDREIRHEIALSRD